jgi:uncharacterized protein (TIGR00730 family)
MSIAEIKKVGIFCSGKYDMKDEYITIVSTILKKINIDKIAIVYGGGNVGLMGIIRDVYKGKIISSNLSKFVNNNSETMRDDYIFDKISERQSKLIELSDMFIVFPGGFGTMYECLEVITKNQIGEHSKKIIIFNYKGLYNHLYEQFILLCNEGFIKNPLHYYNIEFLTENDIDVLINYIHE